MGGIGSGRRPSHAGKDTTEDSMPLDIRRLRRAGVLTPGRFVGWQWTQNDRVYASIRIIAGTGSLALAYSYTPRGQTAESVRQTVRIETTPCNLGGHRQWFTCPSCTRRVAVIYGAGRLFTCRTCKGLAHASQGESDDDRAARRADRIRKRLGWKPGILNDPGVKPKGMHLRTFRRLVAEYDTRVAAALAGMGRRLGLINGMLADTRDRMLR